MLMSLLAAQVAAIQVPVGATPLLDGRCEAAEWQASAVVAADGSYGLRALRDSRFVYLCLDYPEGSLGMVDIYLTTPKVPAPTNLHASAKLGERRRSSTGWPKYSWWNERGWTTQVNALQANNAGAVTFHATAEKEFQIALDRFGAGEWRLMAEVLNDRDGTVAARFPAGSNQDEPATYQPLRVR